MEDTGLRAVVMLRPLQLKSTEDKAKQNRENPVKNRKLHWTIKQKDENVLGELSDYELERLENIRKNQAFLSSIKLSQVKEELRQSVRPKRVLKSGTSRVKEVLPPRKSQRLEIKGARASSLPPNSPKPPDIPAKKEVRQSVQPKRVLKSGTRVKKVPPPWKSERLHGKAAHASSLPPSSPKPPDIPTGNSLTVHMAKGLRPPRMSQRLQGKDARVSSRPRRAPYFPKRNKTPGPLPMEAINMEEDSLLPPMLLKLCSEKLPEEEVVLGLEDYCAALKGMTLGEDGVARVVEKKITCVALHPSPSSLLAATGDSTGQLGLWNPGASWGQDGVLLFHPHTRHVGCMAFSYAHPTHLLSLSYDASLRCMDVEKAVFTDVYDVGDALKTFDFLSEDCSTLVVGSWYGDIAFVDRRVPGTDHELLISLHHNSCIRCVSVHPRYKQYFVVAEEGEVKIYDSRFLKAVSVLSGEALEFKSAYFSPGTGNTVLTTCKDQLRIYDTSAMTEVSPLQKSIRKNMKLGGYLTGLSAVWDPKQAECFAVGSLKKPYRLEVFHQSGKLLHSFINKDHLTSVLSPATFHPARNALLGGNGEGRLHIFTD